MIEQLLQYLVVDELPDLPEIDFEGESIEDYVSSDEIPDSVLEVVAISDPRKVYIVEDIAETEIEQYEVDLLEEDYSSYVMEEAEDEEIDEMRLDTEYIMSLYDANDPDEKVVIFWQRYIAKLPKHLWYMSY